MLQNISSTIIKFAKNKLFPSFSPINDSWHSNCIIINRITGMEGYLPGHSIKGVFVVFDPPTISTPF